MVERTVALSMVMRELMQNYWPGAIAIIAPVRPDAQISPLAVAADGTVAIRVSASTIARDVAARIGAPLVSTSANRAGQPACTSVAALRAQLGEEDFAKIDEVIDVGELPSSLPSTIIRIADDGVVTVVRQGSVQIYEPHTTL
jgi:L-threonylcarbamoyladenylate synthase